MRSSLKSVVALALLIISVVMTLGDYGMSSSRLAHDIDHAIRGFSAIGSHEHPTLCTAVAMSPATPLSPAEHQLLHNSGHVQLSLNLIQTLTPLVPAGSLLVPAAYRPWVASDETDPPFRPPRTAALV